MAFESGTPQFLLDTSTDDHGNINYKEIKCLPVRDESGKVFQVVILARDITDDRRKSEEIKSLNDKLKKAFFQITRQLQTLAVIKLGNGVERCKLCPGRSIRASGKGHGVEGAG